MLSSIFSKFKNQFVRIFCWFLFLCVSAKTEDYIDRMPSSEKIADMIPHDLAWMMSFLLPFLLEKRACIIFCSILLYWYHHSWGTYEFIIQPFRFGGAWRPERKEKEAGGALASASLIMLLYFIKCLNYFICFRINQHFLCW